MTGPSEVQFGEKALYSVTVTNPGTGVAENVTVMLPEVLGGERATLGDIEPGSQKQLTVELIAPFGWCPRTGNDHHSRRRHCRD